MSKLSKSLRAEVCDALGNTSVWARARAYLQIDPDGRRGARRVRAYQELFGSLLEQRERRESGRAAKIDRVRVAAARRNWEPRSARWTHDQRVCRRAAARGLDRLAVRVAHAYHARVNPITRSQYAGVDFGRGGREVVDWSVYAKSYSRPARYTQAGATVRFGPGRAVEVAVWRSRGRLERVVPLPTGVPVDRLTAALDLLLDGQVLARRLARRHRGAEVYRLYGVSEGYTSLRPQGLAVRLRGGEVVHGDTLADIDGEVDARRAAARRARLAGRDARRARLVARLCDDLRVEYRHARAGGLCAPGIASFCRRHGIDSEKPITAGRLRSLGDPRVEPAIAAASAELVELRAGSGVSS